MSSIPDLWSIPLSPPPHGIVSDFNRKSDMLGLVIAVLCIMLCLTTTILVLRFCADREAWKLDDWCAISTFVITIAAGSVLVPYTRAVGKQNWDIPLGLLMSVWPHRMVLTLVVTTNFALFSGKCCVLALYHRIFGQRVRYQIYGVVVVSLPIPLMGIAVLAICVPRPGKPWRSFEADGETLRLTTLLTSIFSLVVDVLILLIPIPLVLKLNLSWRRRAGVLAIFLTGLLAIVSSVVATYYRACLFRAVGGMRYSIVSALCLCVESSTSVIVSSMPSAAKIWKRHIVGTSFYAFLRARLPIAEPTSSRRSDLPSDIKKAKEEVEARKKRRSGPFSLPSILTGDFSVRHASQKNNHMASPSLESRCEVIEKPCPKLNDPSNYMGESNFV